MDPVFELLALLIKGAALGAGSLAGQKLLERAMRQGKLPRVRRLFDRASGK